MGNGAIRALARTGVWAAQITGLVEATDLDTTAQDEGGGHVTRTRQMTDTRGQVHAIEVTIYGGKLSVLIDGRTTIPLAGKVVPINAHAGLSMRALVTQARTNVAGHARLHKVVLDRGCLDGVDWWWLDQQGMTLVVPAKDHLAVTADARAPAAAGEGLTSGCRVHTIRQGQGRAARTARLETEVVGITGLTTSDQSGTPEHGRAHHRRDCEANPIKAVVVRQWQGRDDGPGGNTVCLTNASGQQPWQPFDDDDERRLIEHCGIKAAKQPWELGHPPQKTDRAVRVHVVFTPLMCALATADRLPCAPADSAGAEPVGWQRWRRLLLEHTRNQVIVCAQGCDGMFQRAEYSLRLGVHRKDRPPGIGTRQHILANYRLTADG